MNLLRIATRQSPLALWQANFVKTALLKVHADLEIQILPFITEGDRRLTASLAKIGGKGLFVKELEMALLEGKADIAVHSIKDMPAVATPGLILATICEREDPRDAFLSLKFSAIEALPLAAVVGTSSSRRACLLHDIRPDLKIKPLRGNVGTRLHKLDEGQYDAIILAAAGLKRLGEAARIRAYLDPQIWTPAVGQGAVGIECRDHDVATLARLVPLDHAVTRYCVTAERAFNSALNGGCQLPIAAHAIYINHELHIRSFVAYPDQKKSIRAEQSGTADNAVALGNALAATVLQKNSVIG